MGCSSSKELQKSAALSGRKPSHLAQASSSLGDGNRHLLAQRSIAKRETATKSAVEMLEMTKGLHFHDHYVRQTLVSYGASCKVLTAYNKRTNEKVAVKTIPKNTRNPEAQRASVLNEIGIMKEVEEHPNAIRLLEVYEEPHSYYIVMDCCDGGELFEHITKGKDAFTERHAAQILRSLMLFLAHMHSKGMAHMDIKPENIMFDSEGAQGVVKVIDFGSSIYIQPEETVKDAFGTVRYSSPEMAADDGIGQKTDVWSAGVVMFFMLCGSAPFLKKHEVDTLNYIKNKPKVKFSGYRWAAISQQAKDCISAMLEVEPAKRPTVQQVLQMPWLRTQVPGPETSIRSDILGHLRSFANQSRMRRLLLGLMAAKISGPEANRLLNQFYTMDSDFSGTIELQELAKVAKQALPDLADAEVANLFHALDLNSTGTVDVKEFFASLLHTMAPENQVDVARKSFVHLDREHSGFVSKQAFVDAMVEQAITSGMDHGDTALLVNELETEFMALDANSDGQLSFEEFKSVLGIGDQSNPFETTLWGKSAGRQGSLSRSAASASAAALLSAGEAQHAGPATPPESSAALNVQGANVMRVALMLKEQTRRTTSNGRNSDSNLHSRASSRISGGGAVASPNLSGRLPESAGAQVGPMSSSFGNVQQMGKPQNQNKNPATAAAVMAAAVAATVAASTSEAQGAASRVSGDASWPKDPASEHARKLRVSAQGSESVDPVWQLQQAWFGVPQSHHTGSEQAPKVRGTCSGRLPGEPKPYLHKGSETHSSSALLAWQFGAGHDIQGNGVNPALQNPVFGRSRSARETGVMQPLPLLTGSAQRVAAQLAQPVRKQRSLTRSNSNTSVKETASSALSILSGRGGCLETVRSMSGRTVSGQVLLGLRQDAVS